MTNPRFRSIELSEMTQQQRQVAERSITGPRQMLTRPLNLFLRSPEFADLNEKTGDYLRFRSPLPDRLKELVVLLVTRHCMSAYPWSVHYTRAIAAGIAATAAEAIAVGRRPAPLKPDEAAVFDFVQSLLDGRCVGDASFDALTGSVGEAGVADLIGLIGYYVTISMAHVVDRVPPIEGGAPKLTPIR